MKVFENKENKDSNIPEFTLGPMKFGRDKCKPIKPPKYQPRFKTINHEDLEQNADKKLNKGNNDEFDRYYF